MSQVTKTIQPTTGGELDHPDGFRIRIPPRAFGQSSVIRVTAVTPPLSDSPGMGMAYLGEVFEVSCSEPPHKRIEVIFAIKADAVHRLEVEKGHPFIEVRQGLTSTLLPAHLKKQTGYAGSDYVIETKLEWQRKADASLVAGYLAAAAPASYIPMPHQFKFFPLDRDANKRCRRAGSSDCSDPLPQSIYPACYPAAWAKLYSAYRLVLPPVKRRLEVGTPHTPDPSPDEDGDHFPTWAMGTKPIGAIPQAIRVEDWRSSELVQIRELRFDLEDSIPVEDAIRERAELIRRTLLSLVGRFRFPVFVGHCDHAWNVFGVDQTGYWSHSQNPNANNLSDWCEWDRADWLEGELQLAADPDEEPHRTYTIKWPINCLVKPRNKRLGSMCFEGAIDAIPLVQFAELHDRRNLAWTPFILPDHPEVSYFWIEDGVALEQDGRPSGTSPVLWDRALGHKIPVPENHRHECDCHEDQGCPRCRTRLQLAFWVSNLTKDELHHYRVDLYFWTAACRWISLAAAPIQLLTPPLGDRRFPVFGNLYPDRYALPSPGPGDELAIQATPDTTPQAAGRPHPFNWQPMAWYIDFNKGHLVHDTIHGIKLVLVCTDPEDDAHCVTQDVKQLWFKCLPPSVW